MNTTTVPVTTDLPRAEDHDCPHCGRCKHCGRSEPVPVWPMPLVWPPYQFDYGFDHLYRPGIVIC